MSLLSALLNDPHRDPHEVWLAIRTDHQRGTGTVDDPWDAGLVQGPTVPVLGIEALPARQFRVTTDGVHGLVEGDRVTIAGVRGSTVADPDRRLWRYWNGNFVISDVSPTTFRFTMPFDTVGTPQGSAITCFRCLARFDEIVANLPPYTTVHLGPGVFCTKGRAENVAGSWMPKLGQRFLGSGRDVTTVRIVNATAADALPYFAFGNVYNQFADYVEVADLTVDCNLPGQPVVAGEYFPRVPCAAIALYGSHIRVRRVRAINFGTLGPHPPPVVTECFVIWLGGAWPDPQLGNTFDNVIEDCVIERPAVNNTYTTTCLALVGHDGIRTHMKGGAVRNCYVNCEYLDRPVPIATITALQNGHWLVRTRIPHGRMDLDDPDNQWVVISGARENGAPSPSFNGSFRILSSPTSDTFQITPAGTPVAPDDNSDMWIGRAPSHRLKIEKIEVVDDPEDEDPNAKIATVTTWQPHYRLPASNGVPRNNAWIDGVDDGEKLISGLNGSFPVQTVPSPKEFTFNTTAQLPSDFSLGIVGAHLQAIGVGGTTGAFIEGNRILNNYFGIYQDQGSGRDLIIRKNYVTDARAGVVLGTNSSSGIAGTPLDFGPYMSGDPTKHPTYVTDEQGKYIATFYTQDDPTSSVTDLVEVQGVEVDGETANPFNGRFVVMEVNGQGKYFKYEMSSEPEDGPIADGEWAPQKAGYRLTFNGRLATFHTPSDKPHGLPLGQGVRIQGAVVRGPDGRYPLASDPNHTNNPFNGDFVIKAVTPDSFTYEMKQVPSENPVGSINAGAVWQTGNLRVEDNWLELVPGNQAAGSALTGIHLNGLIPDPYVYRRVLIENNVIRHLDDIPAEEGSAFGLNLSGCGQVLAQDNLVQVGYDERIRTTLTGVLTARNNHTSSGALVRGWNQDRQKWYDDLSDLFDDLWVL